MLVVIGWLLVCTWLVVMLVMKTFVFQFLALLIILSSLAYLDHGKPLSILLLTNGTRKEPLLQVA